MAVTRSQNTRATRIGRPHPPPAFRRRGELSTFLAMFVCVARVTLEIPASGSLKAKRQILRRVTDRVKARFNVSVAEVDDNELWQRAVIGLAVVGNERRHVNEQMDKILQFVDDMYVAPVVSRELEILPFGDQLFHYDAGYSSEPSGRSEEAEGAGFEAEEPPLPSLVIPKGDRSLAEAEGLGEWDERHQKGTKHPGPPSTAGGRGDKLSLDEARARARSLRNRREWEKE